jgi:pyridoxamine 5'-phosphate oxidase
LQSIDQNNTLPPWRIALARSLHLNRSLPQSRYLQLATKDERGWPRNRTVVFRGWLEPSSRLQFVTDVRSAKIQALSQYPEAEICWYFAKTREQYRIAGLLQLEREGTNRQRAWQAISEKAQQQFGWPPPGEARAKEIAFAPRKLDPLNPPETFGLLLLLPQLVDFLQLRGNPQNRWSYELKGREWQTEDINP